MLKFKSWDLLTNTNTQFYFRRLLSSDDRASCSGHGDDPYMASHMYRYLFQGSVTWLSKAKVVEKVISQLDSAEQELKKDRSKLNKTVVTWT